MNYQTITQTKTSRQILDAVIFDTYCQGDSHLEKVDESYVFELLELFQADGLDLDGLVDNMAAPEYHRLEMIVKPVLERLFPKVVF